MEKKWQKSKNKKKTKKKQKSKKKEIDISNIERKEEQESDKIILVPTFQADETVIDSLEDCKETLSKQLL